MDEHHEKNKIQESIDRIDDTISKFFESLEASEKKLSVADVIRLLELRKQLASDEIREVQVTWVESNMDPSAFSR
jgi:hypothetical protein